ncbi:MAG: DUF1800 domain-containing protein [Sandaracinaceae bacterium]
MPTRREALAAAAAGLALTGCDRALAGAARLLADDLPATVAVPEGAVPSAARHLLNRAAFGPWPGDEARVDALGVEGWLDEQLDPRTIDDRGCELRTAFIDAVHLPSDLAFEVAPRHVEEQLTSYTLLRAVYSRRQLQESLVGFWSDHFHIALGKSLCRHLKAVDDRAVIRPHALGSFRTLLGASARSPAMLVYLDGRDNAVGKGSPNENYARELLELHALGLDGGYTQRDVMEAARCLSGWTVLERGAPGAVRFVPARHDDGPKIVLGQRIGAGGGAADLDRLLDVVVAHPSCSRHIATQLARFFVADDPPASVVAAARRTFRGTGGDIAATVRTILTSEGFAASRGTKVKRPFRFVVSALRGLGAETDARGDLRRHLGALGQAPFQHPTPDGYPRDGAAYLGTLLGRWRFALALAGGQLDDTRVTLSRLRASLGGASRRASFGSRLFAHMVGRRPTAPEARALRRVEGDRVATLAVVLSSPGFQRC